MAHMLSEVSGRAECFTAGDKPWHGLGKNVPERVTSKEAIELAGLDWEVYQAPALYKHDFINKVPNRFVNYRIEEHGDPVYLGLVSDQYKVIQNTDAFEFFDEVIGKNLAIYETAGAIRNGKRIWILAKLPEDFILNTQAGEDRIEKYLLFVNGHDGAFGCRMFYTPIRVVCNNTMTIALNYRHGSGITIQHRGDIESKVNEAKRILGIANHFYSEMGKTFQHMADLPITNQEVKAYFQRVLPDADEEASERTQRNIELRRNLMFQNFYKGAGSSLHRGTIWGAYNAVTEYTDHQRYMIRSPRSESTRFESVIWGDSAHIKTKAYKEAVKVAQSA